MKIKKMNKKERTIGTVFGIISLLSIIILLVSYNVSNIHKIQQDYVNEVRDQFKTISKYDKYNFSKEVYEISQKYPVSVELSEDDKVIFSTLNFYIDDINKDNLSMLSKDTMSVGDNREIWLGVYDAIDYSQTFNKVFMMTFIYIIIYAIMLLTLLYLWVTDRKELEAELLSMKNSSGKDLISDFKINIEKEDQEFTSFAVSEEEPVIEEESVTVEDEFENIKVDSLEEITEREEIEANEEIVEEVEPLETHDVSEVVDDVDYTENNDVLEVENKYSNFTNKYDYLGGK